MSGYNMGVYNLEVWGEKTRGQRNGIYNIDVRDGGAGRGQFSGSIQVYGVMESNGHVYGGM